MIIGICIFAIIISIIINFAMSNSKEDVKDEKKSIVETGTMTLFFIFFYLIIKTKIGDFDIEYTILRYILLITGTMVIIIGCVVNILGRITLGNNWGNQIRIYHNHSLVYRGVYKIVRHPLYASLIWMFYGAALVYFNVGAFIANTFIFIPFMYYRAKQEEKMLEKTFKEYNEYRSNTGMFFPNIISRRSKNEGM